MTKFGKFSRGVFFFSHVETMFVASPLSGQILRKNVYIPNKLAKRLKANELS